MEKIVFPFAVKLTIPRKWKIHDVFHVSLIKPFRTVTNAVPDPSQVLCEVNNIENSTEYDVDDVMASAKKGRHVLYLIKLLDYPDQWDWTNERLANFSVGGLEKHQEFHRWNPDVPSDYRLTEE